MQFGLLNELLQLPPYPLPPGHLRSSPLCGEGVSRTELCRRDDLCLLRERHSDGTPSPNAFSYLLLNVARIGKMRPEGRKVQCVLLQLTVFSVIRMFDSGCLSTLPWRRCAQGHVGGSR